MSITPFFHVYHKYVFIMANISKIKISGTSYNLKDENACNVVELTQAEYDDLPTSAKTSNSLFVITDATAGDLSNYYTKSEADGLLDTKLDVTAYTPTDLSNYYTKSETSGATEISTALASKQTTLTAGTGISIVDNVISATGGGGGGLTEDDELLLSTALTDLNDRKIDASEVKSNYQMKGDYATKDYVTTALEPYETKLDEINTEEVTAYALNDLNNRFGGLSLVKITESEYAALATKDENTLYVVVADQS